MQLLILAHTTDRGAQAVAMVLSRHSGLHVLLVRPEWLGQADWSQHISAHGRAHTRLRCPGLGEVDAAQIDLVWNRARWLPQARFRESTAADRDYAASELHALVTSFLAELGPRVVPPMRNNPTLPTAPHKITWMMTASDCGLRIADVETQPPQFRVLVTPERLHGPGVANWSNEQTRACHTLATRLGFAILELGFVGEPAAPRLCHIDVHPELATAVEVELVAQWLRTQVPP